MKLDVFMVNFMGENHHLVTSEEMALVLKVHVVSWLPGLHHKCTSIPVGIQGLLRSGLYAMAH